MARTTQLALPLVMPSQAQKHVTVNEALLRLDAIVNLKITASDVASPPNAADEGTSFIVPSGADGAWAGRAGHVAVRSNGGWLFLVPKVGWLAWDEPSGQRIYYDGVDWVGNVVAASPGGARSVWNVVEHQWALVPGSSNVTSAVIPAGAQVFGVTGRVAQAITGSGLTSWRIGVSGSDNRYGSGLGLGQNSYLIGMSGSPVTYYGDSPLLITAEGGNFGVGRINFAIHYLKLVAPREI